MVLSREVHVVIGQRLLHTTKDKKIKLNNKNLNLQNVFGKLRNLLRLTAVHGRARTRQEGEHGLTVQFSPTDPRKYSLAVRTVNN
jgi:hypothetical protein